MRQVSFTLPIQSAKITLVQQNLWLLYFICTLVEFVGKKINNAIEIMCTFTLRISIDFNLVAFIFHFWMKPPVEFVRRKLDNAIEIMCTVRHLIDFNLVAFMFYL